MASECVFCDIISGKESASFVTLPQACRGRGVIAFRPLKQHSLGHTLFVHEKHSVNAAGNPNLAAEAFKVAALAVRLWGMQANILTSVGPAATQTIMHTHIHVIPRGHPLDELPSDWPWMREDH